MFVTCHKVDPVRIDQNRTDARGVLVLIKWDLCNGLSCRSEMIQA